MKTHVVCDLTADRVYLVKAETAEEAVVKLKSSFTEDHFRREHQAIVDLIIGVNKDTEHTNKWIEEQLAEGRQCCLEKRAVIEPPTYEEFVGEYELKAEAVFELVEDITPLDQTVLVGYSDYL